MRSVPDSRTRTATHTWRTEAKCWYCSISQAAVRSYSCRSVSNGRAHCMWISHLIEVLLERLLQLPKLQLLDCLQHILSADRLPLRFSAEVVRTCREVPETHTCNSASKSQTVKKTTHRAHLCCCSGERGRQHKYREINARPHSRPCLQAAQAKPSRCFDGTHMIKIPALREKAALASFPIWTLSGSTDLITRCTHAWEMNCTSKQSGTGCRL